METNKIYVDNISLTMERSTIERAFAGYGDILEINYPVDNASERPLGFAYITFFSPQAARRSLEKDGRDFGGQRITVTLFYG